MTNIQIYGCNFEAKILKDYEPFELVEIDIDLGPDRHSVILVTYEELDAYRDAYNDTDFE